VKPKYFQTVQKGARTYEELSNKGQFQAVLNMSSVFLKDIQTGTYGFANEIQGMLNCPSTRHEGTWWGGGIVQFLLNLKQS
jgi:hypothetical protein